MAEETKPFDLTVHVVNQKTKRIEKVQPYIRHCEKLPEGGSQVLYERDGKFYHENNGEVPVSDEDNFILQARKKKEDPQKKRA